MNKKSLTNDHKVDGIVKPFDRVLSREYIDDLQAVKLVNRPRFAETVQKQT